MKSKKLLLTWLWSGVFLVAFMVVVGGITRLTGSGLSIVKWNIVTGTIPPMSQNEWAKVFAEYQQTPQFKQINHSFTLDDFKGIYWWEYFHRLAGRIIGVIFLIPYLLIMFSKQFPFWLKRHLTIILVLGMLQGVMGWLMVKSGLLDLPYVSHYRLAMHLTFALALIGAITWTIQELKHTDEDRQVFSSSSTRFFFVTASALFVQIILGAFVAGLKAGFYYNTFPLMGDAIIPENVFVSVHNGVLIQFAHRWFAFAVALLIIVSWMKYRKTSPTISRYLNWLLAGVLMQVALGIITLLYKVPVFLGVAHQLAAVGLFTIVVILIYEISAGFELKDANDNATSD